jgi:hypothetical protein
MRMDRSRLERWRRVASRALPILFGLGAALYPVAILDNDASLQRLVVDDLKQPVAASTDDADSTVLASNSIAAADAGPIDPRNERASASPDAIPPRLAAAVAPFAATEPAADAPLMAADLAVVEGGGSPLAAPLGANPESGSAGAMSDPPVPASNWIGAPGRPSSASFTPGSNSITPGNPLPGVSPGGASSSQPPSRPVSASGPSSTQPVLGSSSPVNSGPSAAPVSPTQPAPAGTSNPIGAPISPVTPVPGQSPSNPIRPIGSSPTGTEILPIAGAGCTANCGSSNAWRFFDPPVAIGYNYQLNPTNSNQPLTFGITGIMATTKVGSGVYDLWLYDTNTGTYVDSKNFSSNGQTITIIADPTANPTGEFDVVNFLSGLNSQQDQELGITDPYLGLTRFSIRGIDPAAGLDPEDLNAFITGLLFAGSINGDLLITPLAVDSVTNQPVDPPDFEVAVPEPPTAALFITALAAFGFLGRRRKRRWATHVTPRIY